MSVPTPNELAGTVRRTVTNHGSTTTTLLFGLSSNLIERMAHPKLVKPDQPLPTRCLLRTYEMCASLRLAVVLIFTLAATLAFATFVEGAYGTAAVQFFVYQTWWFNGLNAMLAVNIFCAAAIRFPWQRHQTGFVITHIGLLTLLFGAMIGRFQGIDAKSPSTKINWDDMPSMAVTYGSTSMSARLQVTAATKTCTQFPFQAVRSTGQTSTDSFSSPSRMMRKRWVA